MFSSTFYFYIEQPTTLGICGTFWFILVKALQKFVCFKKSMDITICLCLAVLEESEPLLCQNKETSCDAFAKVFFSFC